MRIGIVGHWFNRGQGVVARHLRSALDQLGHETFVLARPTRATNRRPAFIDRTDVWDQPGVTDASVYDVPLGEYERWVQANRVEVAFFDQNYQFEEIAALRRQGLATVGRFVWEAFGSEHAEAARDAYEVVYSLTACEQERYAAMGIDSPRVVWGCHPELTAIIPRRDERLVTFFFPGGFMSKRKPTREVMKAFSRARGADLRLVVKAQVPRREGLVTKLAARDERILLVGDELPTGDHLRLFASADVCLAPSRWEGLGLHLYEATAFGMPIVTNDNPPMNELVVDGRNGILVRGHANGTARSGIPAYDPDEGELIEAVQRLSDPAERERLASGAREVRERLSWDRTVTGLRELIETRVMASTAPS